MVYISKQAVALAASLIGCVVAALGQPPACSTTAPSGLNSPPMITWTPLDVAGNTGTYFTFYGGTSPLQTEQTGQTVSGESPFELPGMSSGSFTFAAGNMTPGTDVYPAGTTWSPTAWVVNNSSSLTSGNASSSIDCTVGADESWYAGWGMCSMCNTSNGNDCYGQTMPRFPNSGMKSANFASSKGLQFAGSFAGQASWPAVGSSSVATSPITETVYYHASPAYTGGAEYGFFTYLGTGTGSGGIAGPQTVYFYYDTYSNCTDVWGNKVCSSTEPMSPSYTVTPDHGTEDGNGNPGPVSCSLANTPTNSDTYVVYTNTTTGGDNYFVIQVTNTSTMNPDPSGGGTYYVGPIATGIGNGSSTGGYVTVGIQRFDPYGTEFATQEYNTSDVPRLNLSSVKVGS